MNAVDTNILVYAHRREIPEHAAAVSVMAALSEGSAAWALPWPCVYEFFSVVTNPRIWRERASTPEQAWAQVAAWTGSPTVRLLHEPPGFVELFYSFATRRRVVGPMVHDARVAALCVAHGVDRLLTRDRDFSLFPELRTHNPLV
jgi:toxin-antitoxin system PIN domain toxin